MSKDKTLTAIDVGSSKIAVVIASTGRGLTDPSVIGVSSLESSGIKKGQIVDINQAVASISKAVELAEKMAGTSVGRAIISVGGSHISSINSKGVVAVAQPEGEITNTDIKRVVEAARAISLPSAREILHVLPRDYTVDGQAGIKDPKGMTGVRLEVETQIVTGSATAIHNLVKSITEVGIDVDGVVFSGLASAESVLTETEKELGVVMLDIGGGTTDVAIYIEGALSYSAVLPVGAKNVTNDLAVGLRISLESAEKVKLFLSHKDRPKVFGTADQEISASKPKTEDELDVSHLKLSEEIKKVSRKTVVDGIIKPRLQEIFSMVGLEIQKSGFVGMTPAGVVLSGGGAETVGIVEVGRHRLGMPVRVGMPSGLSGLIDELSGPSSAVVIGLIKHSMKTNSEFYTSETNTSSLPSLPSFGKMAGKLPGGNVLKNLTGLLKNFLP